MPQGAKPLLAITGGTGFVGAHVICEALNHGYHVRALIRNPARAYHPPHDNIAHDNLAHDNLAHDNLEWIKGALGDDDPALVHGADCVIHIAGLIKARNREAFDAVNVTAAANLARAAEQAGVKRFVLLSSMAAREPGLSDYAASKHAGEIAVREAYSGPIAILRAPAVFGPGDQATKPFFDAVRRGVLPLPGGRGWKERKLSIVYVKDLARDIIGNAVTGTYDGRTVSPASWPDVSWQGFAKMLSDAKGANVRPLPLPLALLYPVAAATSLSSHLFGKGHLTLGKLNEFLYQDWSSDDPITDATSPTDALKDTLRFYNAIEER